MAMTPRGRPAPAENRADLRAPPTAVERVLSLIMERRFATVAEIAAASGLAPKTVSVSLSSLRREGWCVRNRVDREILWIISADTEREIRERRQEASQGAPR
jgi:DNA-binding IclR family transcriptional regulator